MVDNEHFIETVTESVFKTLSSVVKECTSDSKDQVIRLRLSIQKASFVPLNKTANS